MIRKLTYTLTVLIQDDDIPEDYDPSLTDLDYLISDGPGIGNLTHDGDVIVPPEAVEAELLAVGNDGSFFDEYYEGIDESEWVVSE